MSASTRDTTQTVATQKPTTDAPKAGTKSGHKKKRRGKFQFAPIDESEVPANLREQLYKSWDKLEVEQAKKREAREAKKKARKEARKKAKEKAASADDSKKDDDKEPSEPDDQDADSSEDEGND